MVNVALLVRLEAKPGKEDEVEAFLKSGLAIVEEEPDRSHCRNRAVDGPSLVVVGPRRFIDKRPSDADPIRTETMFYGREDDFRYVRTKLEGAK